MALVRGRRVRHADLGRLVQQSPATGAHRQHPAGRSRGTLLRHAGRTGHGSVTQTIWPPANPGRFNSSAVLDLIDRLKELADQMKRLADAVKGHPHRHRVRVERGRYRAPGQAAGRREACPRKKAPMMTRCGSQRINCQWAAVALAEQHTVELSADRGSEHRGFARVAAGATSFSTSICGCRTPC
jgi:hypothetical protein